LRAKSLPSPQALIEIEDRAGLLHEQGIAREDPASMPPRADGVFVEPAPKGGSASLGHQPLIENFLADLGDREARQGRAGAMGQLTGEELLPERRGWGGKRAFRRPRGSPSRPGKRTP
jgi:hypothetical protein